MRGENKKHRQFTLDPVQDSMEIEISLPPLDSSSHFLYYLAVSLSGLT